MSKYLYGAAVQGIQEFIFRTNDLSHIVGASELVEQICTSEFDEFMKEGDDVVRAAGNIKYIFNEEEDCKEAVLRFPRKVMNDAPGITISQTVVLLSDNFDDKEFGKAIDLLEEKLKTQRNKPAKSVTSGLMGIKRANNTGLPVVEVRKTKIKGELKELYLDDATKAKLDNKDIKGLCKKSFGQIEGNLAYDISQMTDKNDWIAIIHADGNGLGQVVQKVGKKKEKFREFSRLLDEATEEAAHVAYKNVVQGKAGMNGVIPARPVVLSGDDMTIIIRGDLAIDYATSFITAFEEQTERKLGSILQEFKVFEGGEKKLTACAGIAFIKSSYPFYYGYQLAEELCGAAKKDTKKEYNFDKGNLPASCLMFHKVQDSFITDYKAIVERELTAKDELSFKAGPYYTGDVPAEGRSINSLTEASDMLSGDDSEGIKSGIRNWISIRLTDKNMADQRKNRMNQIYEKAPIIKTLTSEQNGTCIAYDVLAYHTIMHQQTNENQPTNE